ncbi:substrate-binding domain-containing protein [Caldimonas tepidiphila]|uniref:substrate-binding domain-containing protein n=1 Tax=Caldimonas tepidiphila TaxID=2315841 RepID=UPI000E5AC8D3|nr:substrate-binding domain-containing protein [Caldimonas tepidiphila]
MSFTPLRRRLLLTSLALLAPGALRANPQPGVPLTVGMATSLVDSALAERVRRAFAGDTGLALVPRPGPSARLLQQLERGEIDIAITHAPALELALEQQGLASGRQFVAASDFVIAGPAAGGATPRGQDPADVRGERDAARALQRIAASGAPFMYTAEGCGAQFAADALWQAGGGMPAGTVLLRSDAGMGATLALAAQVGAYLLVDRPTWAASRRRGSLAVLVEGDARLATRFHALRSSRSGHPSARLFLQWLAGPAGRKALAAAPHYRLEDGATAL